MFRGSKCVPDIINRNAKGDIIKNQDYIDKGKTFKKFHNYKFQYIKEY